MKIGVELKDENISDHLTHEAKGFAPRGFDAPCATDLITVSAERLSLFSENEMVKLRHSLKACGAELMVKSGDYLASLNKDSSILLDRFLSIPIEARGILIFLKNENLERAELIKMIKRASEHRDELENEANQKIDLYFKFQACLGAEDLIMHLEKMFSEKLRFKIASDPLWHTPQEILSLSELFFIEGRHPIRWVRRYSEKQLIELSQLTRKHEKTGRLRSVVFSHSGRWEQLPSFKEKVNAKTLKNLKAKQKNGSVLNEGSR